MQSSKITREAAEVARWHSVVVVIVVVIVVVLNFVFIILTPATCWLGKLT